MSERDREREEEENAKLSISKHADKTPELFHKLKPNATLDMGKAAIRDAM